jgi:hypothetical protein
MPTTDHHLYHPVADQIAGLSPLIFILVVLAIIVLIVWLVRR